MKIQALNQQQWLGLVLAAMIGGGGIAYWLSDRSIPPIISNSVPTPSSVATTNASIYWIEAQTKKFVAVPIAVKPTAPTKVTGSQEQQLIAAAMADLLQPVGQRDQVTSRLYSAIPVGTKVLDLAIKNGDIYLNLSPEFRSGGGSASMRGRVVQVLYTATSLNPKAKLFLSVAGVPLQSLGGEGLELSQPLQRQDWALDF